MLLARLAKQPLPGSEKAKAAGAKDLLEGLRLDRTRLAGADAGRIAYALRGDERVISGSKFLAQHKIMLGLLQWVDCVAKADCALDAQDHGVLTWNLSGANDSLGLNRPR